MDAGLMDDKKKKHRTQTGFKIPFKDSKAQCANCNVLGSERKLQECTRCGMVAYCGRECQKAAYPEHKEWCRLTADTHNADDMDGERRVLFSRSFGAAMSMMLTHGRAKCGRGMISAVCSHRFSEYCGARRAADDLRGGRKITITYVPERAVEKLEREALNERQPQTDAAGPGLLKGGMDALDMIGEELLRRMGQTGAADRFVLLGMQSPHQRRVNAIFFLSYMEVEHPAHKDFAKTVGGALSIVLDWDGHDEAPLQWLLCNAIGPKFYQECSLAYQEKVKKRDPSPFPGGVLTPPFCQHHSIERVPVSDPEAAQRAMGAMRLQDVGPLGPAPGLDFINKVYTSQLAPKRCSASSLSQSPRMYCRIVSSWLVVGAIVKPPRKGSARSLQSAATERKAEVRTV